MATTSSAADRILTLDIVRGVAVMGILAMNIVAFAMPPQAYVNPLAYGTETTADLASFAFSFVLIDGKMRGLFSFLFGASMLLVIQLAEARGESPGKITFARQLWLLVFGLLHFYLIWFGDILTGYALIGMLAWFFRDKAPQAMIVWGIALLFVQLLIMGGSAAYAHSLAAQMAAANPPAAVVAEWASLGRDIAVPSAEMLSEDRALHLGPWTGLVQHQLTEKLFMPLIFTGLFGAETLAYMLFGMAALKSGFLAGSWQPDRYRRTAITCFAIGIPLYLLLAWAIFVDRFSVEGLFTYSFAATVPIRPVMILGTAALVILLTRDGGALVDRIAATGRAAFSNYLGTSIVMTGLFYGWGLGLYGEFSRVQLWLVVIAMWVAMLAWSKPWLERFNYGPLEWAWRSLARGKPQPMRKTRPIG